MYVGKLKLQLVCAQYTSARATKMINSQDNGLYSMYVQVGLQ